MPALYSIDKFCKYGNFVRMKTDFVDLKKANDQLAELDALGRIGWAREMFGDGVVASTSFGLQSAVMIDLINKVSKEIPIIFIDTGYLFPGTYEYAIKLQEKLGLQVSIYSAKQSPAFQEASFGKLWEQGKEGMTKYNWMNKKEPMDRALQETGAKIWMAGLRRSQSVGRENLNFLEQQKGVLKLYPILDWDDRKTYQYIPQNGLPYHPLEGMGYDSVGDWHSTKKISEVENVEEARHGGHGRECGLHLEVPEGTDFNV
jgi:phosphoadenosine phosphosulfate reductase